MSASSLCALDQEISIETAVMEGFATMGKVPDPPSSITLIVDAAVRSGKSFISRRLLEKMAVRFRDRRRHAYLTYNEHIAAAKIPRRASVVAASIMANMCGDSFNGLVIVDDPFRGPSEIAEPAYAESVIKQIEALKLRIRGGVLLLIGSDLASWPRQPII